MPQEETTAEDDGPVRVGSMRDEIIRIVVDALNEQGFPGLTLHTVRCDSTHREAFIDMLRDCRPLPVVMNLIRDAETGRL
ncbi:MAG: hypothetical protein OXC91_12245 [Rhodobacteraceae bacterium]|nr:hypothetical protein [Paracoccaceae bacterium]